MGRKATLHFCLYGLRDIPTSNGLEMPIVKVQVKKFQDINNTATVQGTKKAKYFELTFPDPAEEPEPAEDVSRDKALKKWQTDGLGRQGNWNFEVFRAQKLSILVPDEMLLQPFMSIRVYERPSAGMLQRAGLAAEE